MEHWIKYSYLLIFSVLLILIGLLAGPSNLTLKEIFEGLFVLDEEHISSTIIWNIRIPRIAVSIVTGACLGLAGVLIQLSTRSTFGDPNLFGVGGGSIIFLATATAGIVALNQITIFVGCLISSLLVALVLSKLISSKDLSPVKLAIIGIAIGALTVSIGTSIISLGRVFPTQVIGLITGSFSSSNWETLKYIFPTFTICLGSSLLLSKKFYPIMLGDVLSKSLGVNPINTRTLSMGLVGILAGSAVFAGGLIAFIGLLSPHITRRLLNNSPTHLVIGSSWIGAILAIGADQISRLLFAPTELPVGMATTILGAPLMIYLACKMK